METSMHCRVLTKGTYLVNTEIGFKRALRIELAKGDLSYSPTVEYVAPRFPLQYPKVVSFETTTKITVRYYSLAEYRIKLLKIINKFDQLTNRKITE